MAKKTKNNNEQFTSQVVVLILLVAVAGFALFDKPAIDALRKGLQEPQKQEAAVKAPAKAKKSAKHH